MNLNIKILLQYVWKGNGPGVQNQYWREQKTDGRSKSWHGRAAGGKDHYWLSHGATKRLMGESHQNTPENEISIQKQKHFSFCSNFLKSLVTKIEISICWHFFYVDCLSKLEKSKMRMRDWTFQSAPCCNKGFENRNIYLFIKKFGC